MGRGCQRSVLSPQRGNDDKAAKRRAQLDQAPVVLQELVLEKPLIVTLEATFAGFTFLPWFAWARRWPPHGADGRRLFSWR